MEVPVLIYIAKHGCGACEKYQPEWEQVQHKLAGRARCVKFDCYAPPEHLPPPPPLAEYSSWYPNLVLAGPKSYGRCFTPDDQINSKQWSDDYTIKGTVMNAVRTPSGYQHAGDPYTAQ